MTRQPKSRGNTRTGVGSSLITANISGGNSGGPLVDNEGKVVGTMSWSSTKEKYNGAMSLNAMCRKIIECDGKYYWDYEE